MDEKRHELRQRGKHLYVRINSDFRDVMGHLPLSFDWAYFDDFYVALALLEQELIREE